MVCSVSASSAGDPVSAAAVPLAVAIAVLAASAAKTLPRLSSEDRAEAMRRVSIPVRLTGRVPRWTQIAPANSSPPSASASSARSPSSALRRPAIATSPRIAARRTSTSRSSTRAAPRTSRTSSPPSSAPRHAWPTGPTGCPSRAASRSRTRGSRRCPPPSARSRKRSGWEADEPPMRLLLLGGPGGGKGTQGARLAERLEVEHVAAGDALRAEVQRGSEIGIRVAGYLDVGELVPDDVVVDLMTPIVAAAARAGGYILDGFPRNLAQAHVADEAWEQRGIGLEAVVYLEVPEPELRRRLLARAEIEGRSDDTPEVIANRLALFAETTFPLVEHYRDRGLLVAIAADQAPEAVTDDVLSRLSDRPRTMEQ